MKPRQTIQCPECGTDRTMYIDYMEDRFHKCLGCDTMLLVMSDSDGLDVVSIDTELSTQTVTNRAKKRDDVGYDFLR